MPHPHAKELTKSLKTVSRDLQLMSFKQSVAIACGLLLTIFLARGTDKETFGDYSLIISVIGTLAITALPGLNNFVIKSSAQDDSEYYLKTIVWSFWGATLGSILLLILRLAHFWIIANLSWALVGLVAILFPFYIGLDTWESYLLGRRDFRRLVGFDSLRVVVVTALTILAVVANGSVLWIVCAFVGATAVFNTFYTYLVARRIPRTASTTGLRKGFYLSLINFIPSIGDSIERIIINLFLGPVVLANYVIASLFAATVRSHLKIILTGLNPRLAIRSTESNARALLRYSWLPLLFGAFFAGLSWVAIPYVLPLAFGAKYDDAVHLAQLMSLTIVLRPLNRLLYTIIVFDESLSTNLLLNTVPTSLRLLSYFIILPMFGAVGIIPAIIVEELVFFGLGTRQLLRAKS